MIAELPTRSAPATEDNLFAGMSIASFPTAPTTAIVLNKNPEVSVAKSVPVPVSTESTEKYDQTLAEEFETTSLLPAEEKTSTKKPMGSLASLYATEVITSNVSAYPELPSIVHRGQISPQRENTSQRTYEDEHPSEYASLLGNTATATAATASSETDPSLISEILRENNRLAEELERMKRLMGQKESTAQVRAAPAPPAMSTSVENPATGVMVNDTTMPPREGVKYVCCGGCRQWLLAPRDAVYVACGTCQAINNCNLTQNRQTVDAETRAITQAPARRYPWFLECFEGVI